MSTGTIADRPQSPPEVPAVADDLAAFPRRRWSTAEFDRMVSAGVLLEGGREFLWDGAIVEPMPENPPHFLALFSLARILQARLAYPDWMVVQGTPLALADGFKPQPDLSVVPGPSSRYRGRTLLPADEALLVEVADTSREKDFGPCLRKYAEAGIPRYWVVDVNGRRIVAHAGPVAEPGAPAHYRDVRSYGLDESVPLVLDRDGQPAEFGLIAVREVLADSLETNPEGTTP